MHKYLRFISICLILMACNNDTKKTETITSDSTAHQPQTIITNNNDSLPPPYATESVRNNSKVLGWPDGMMPAAPAGFTVSHFADSLESARWMYVADNGDLFVAQADGKGEKGNDILLFRDKNGDGIPETKTIYISGLNEPFGMLILKNKFYVANTDAVLAFPYDASASSITAPGKSIVSLPGKGRHWTRNIISNANGDKIFISVGSSSNVGENGIDKETRRANILEVNVDGSGEKVYASGLRNPVGMSLAPGTNTLWVAVNERDELGDELVPDYLTSVKEGAFYGWPYSYFGQHEDPRIKEADKRPDLVQKALKPDVSLGSHTASLGLLFYTGQSFPVQYHGGAFVTQHGSWNRSHLIGYKVVFVPFINGKPGNTKEDFLTGFIADESKSEVYGRPVGLAMLKDGSLLVTDDGANTIWRISYNK